MHSDNRRRRQAAAFSLPELAAVLLALAILIAAGLPAVRAVQHNGDIQTSLNNLALLGVAHVLYAADWDGRQVTWVKDDLGAFEGDVAAYNDAHDCGDYDLSDPDCQPPMIAGWGPELGPWAYWPSLSNNPIFQPLIFPGGPGDGGLQGYGSFRVPNLRSLHEYLNGRYQDPLYYAPADTTVLEDVGPCLDVPWEFDPECNPAWSSYAFSAAAMFHPDVFRSNLDGGWQAPWALDHGYASPGLFQAAYPDLKTHMLEIHWLQDPPAPCNPAFFYDCQPFFFNHGIGSTPATLFYDGHVRLLPSAEVLAADQQIFVQTGGADGVWHRGTPFGAEGFFIPEGFDLTPLSHHVLTTGGILGRDTLGEPAPLAPPGKSPRPSRRPVTPAPGPVEPPPAVPFTTP